MDLLNPHILIRKRSIVSFREEGVSRWHYQRRAETTLNLSRKSYSLKSDQDVSLSTVGLDRRIQRLISRPSIRLLYRKFCRATVWLYACESLGRFRKTPKVFALETEIQHQLVKENHVPNPFVVFIPMKRFRQVLFRIWTNKKTKGHFCELAVDRHLPKENLR